MLKNIYLSVLCLLVYSCAEASSKPSRTSNQAMVPIRIVSAFELEPSCQKLGRVRTSGRAQENQISTQQALHAAQEEAAELGGDTMVEVAEASSSVASSGGSMEQAEKSFDVYACKLKN